MGRSRSREKKDKKEKGGKDKEDKKDKKRSRSREKKKSRSREKKRDKEREAPPPEPRKRSPSLQYRRWRFDSPPKEEDYKRDALITGSAMGMGGVAAALQGGLALGGNMVSPLTLAADTKAMRELYVGNLPAGITSPQLVQFLNQVGQAVKVNSLPGEPVISATLGGGGLFAFVEFRTAEEAANGLRLNGVELLGCQLKIGRPKGYAGPDSAGGMGMMMPGISGGPCAGIQSGGAQLALPGMSSAPGMLALPPGPGGAQGAAVSAIDHRLCLINIPTFVSEDRIKELLVTFGQVKFFALQKDEDGKSVGVAFFEYNDMMTQQQARTALEGLELGAKKLSVKRPEEVIKMGLVAREQKLGARVVPSKVIYLKNIVTPADLQEDAMYQEICADIRLEAEKFGPVTSMEVPRPGAGIDGLGGGAPQNAITAGPGGVVMALEDTKPDATGAIPKAKAAPAPVVPDLSMAIVLAGTTAKAPVIPTPQSVGGVNADGTVAGEGFAFVEFATIEGASKAKKALNGRRFGPQLVEAEYFSEVKYRSKDFAKPLPNTDEPVREPGMELAIFGGGPTSTALQTLEEAPVMAD